MGSTQKERVSVKKKKKRGLKPQKKQRMKMTKCGNPNKNSQTDDPSDNSFGTHVSKTDP